MAIPVAPADASDTASHPLNGKRLLVVGAGYESKSFIFQKALELGVKIVLVDKPNSCGQKFAEAYIEVNTLDHEHAANIAAEKVRALGLQIDGIYNFWEDDVFLTAQIGAKLGLASNPPDAMEICRSKHLTRIAMKKAGLPVPKSYLVNTREELEEAIAQMTFPAVVKPVHGACAMGAVKANNAEEARAAYEMDKKLLSADLDSIFAQGTELVLEQYLDGDEVDVDMLIQDGKILFWSICDNLPTHEPDFVNTGMNLPSILPMKKQLELVDIASRTCLDALGIRMGCAHVEMKYTTKDGPHIVEVNGRMCGNMFPQFIKAVWDVDFIEQGLMIAAGIKINPHKALPPKCAVAGSYILSNGEAVLTQEDVDLFEKTASDPRVFDVHMDHMIGHKLWSGGCREQLGWLTCKGKDMTEAVKNFEAVIEGLEIPWYLDVTGADLLPNQLPELPEAERQKRLSVAIEGKVKRLSVTVKRVSKVQDGNPRPNTTMVMAGAPADVHPHPLRGKRLIFVGAGYESKMFIFEKALELGVKIVLVDKPNSCGRRFAEEYVEVNTMDHEHAAQIAADKVRALGLKIDGIYNFWEDDVFLTAQIGAKLGLACNPPDAMEICRSKHLTRVAMNKVGLPVPRSFLVNTREELEEALKQMTFPAVVKPVHGACAMGAIKVNTIDEARDAYETDKKLLSAELDSIFAQGTELVIEQYLDGDEVDVDMLLEDGKILFWSICDNLPTHEPDFVNTGMNLPSILPMKKQLELVDIASRTCLDALGIRMGCAHVEMKYTTKDGPHIVEVNGRMCGNMFPQFIKAVWDVDFIEQGLMIAAGIKINPHKALPPKCAVAGSYILSNGEAVLTQKDIDLFEQTATDPRVFDVHMDHLVGHKLWSAGGREQLGWLTCKGKDMTEAVNNFEAVIKSLDIPWYLDVTGADLLPNQLPELPEAERQKRMSVAVEDKVRRLSSVSGKRPSLHMDGNPRPNTTMAMARVSSPQH